MQSHFFLNLTSKIPLLSILNWKGSMVTPLSFVNGQPTKKYTKNFIILQSRKFCQNSIIIAIEVDVQIFAYLLHCVLCWCKLLCLVDIRALKQKEISAAFADREILPFLNKNIWGREKDWASVLVGSTAAIAKCGGG